MTDLDQRWQKLIADGRASWKPGMRTANGQWAVDGYPLLVEDGVLRFPESDDHKWSGYLRETKHNPEMFPDWQDPATLGALLGLVRERWGLPDITTSAGGARDGLLWEVECCDPRDFSGYRQLTPGHSTEAEALIAALEGAPNAD